MTIERIKRVPLREVWKHEAYDFTTWLEKNLDILNEHLDITLDPETVRREQAAGAFSVDLVAEDDSGETVVIENQLERSNHDHLGKVLTYLAMSDATKAIWIVADARPEHVRAIAWLNDSSPASFYLLTVEAIRIADSPAAPLLSLIVGPSEVSKEVVQVKHEKTARHAARRRFWTSLLDVANERSRTHSGRSAPDGPYLPGSSGHAGVLFMYGVNQHATSTILWIDKGSDHDDWNEAFFDSLRQHEREIEETFGAPIEWYTKVGNRSRKLIAIIDHGGWTDEDRWPEAIDATVEAMIRLEAAVRQHLDAAREYADLTANSLRVDAS